MHKGDKIYWLSWDGKRKGEYTVQNLVNHVEGKLVGKIFLEERQRPLGEEHVITEIDEFSRFNIHEGRRYFDNVLNRKIFETKIQPYL